MPITEAKHVKEIDYGPVVFVGGEHIGVKNISLTAKLHSAKDTS